MATQSKQARDPDRVARAREHVRPRIRTAALQSLQRVLCERSRVAIVRALRAGPLSVEDIALVIGRPSAATSQHLRVLRDTGVVQANRVANRVYYGLRPSPATEEVTQVLADLERSA